ncbi:MAG: tetratricopeptide repeat protein [Candidatus Omnitrophica bacterium]|nr:tetratricopeptide repeat protein [Candidatus Omnitrophota bacterium]
MQELKAIALNFSYKDSSLSDMFYAENIFKKMEELWGMDAFDEELIYLRGFNLEKNKEYLKAKEIYSFLLKKYPKSLYFDEVTFKLGIISTYALRDPKSGREYFNKLADKKPVTSYSLSSLYQLGLLKQWEGDFSSAKGYYNKLIDGSQGNFEDIVEPAKERLKESEESASLEHNLKTFMDVALKKEFFGLNMSKIDLNSNFYRPAKDAGVEISASVYLSSSGCFNVEIQYLWSGDLGGAKPNIREPGFKASYKNEGTKVIGLVLVSPSGITDYAFDLIDAQ